MIVKGRRDGKEGAEGRGNIPLLSVEETSFFSVPSPRMYIFARRPPLQVRSLFAELGQLLEAEDNKEGSIGSTARGGGSGGGGGGSYLVGDSFTAADLTFACMASWILCPPGYGADISAFEKVRTFL